MAGLNHKHLLYFRAVAHEGTLTRAAARLNLSQSALSVQIRSLEDRLGQALFERRGRSLELTEAGRIALDHADRIAAIGDELVDTLKERGRARRALRVGAMATLSRNFTLGFLRPLIGRSDVEVILRSGGTGALIAGLSALDLDIVLLNRAAPRDAARPLVSHRLAQQPVSLVATPGRLAGQGGDLLDLLAQEPLVLPSADSPVRDAFDALCDRHDLRPQVAAEVDDMAMMRLMARADAGLAVLPPIVVRDELASGALIEAHHLPGIAETFYAVTLERRFPNPLARELLARAGAAAPA